MKFVRKQACACCGYKTIERALEICYVCWWQQDHYQEEVDTNDADGPNYVSIEVARENYRQLGACEKEFVKDAKPPSPHDL
ncbi:hypothetical protein LJ737_07565 [Hymenobacter sp. 15J16-1T3B]|uniref:CPCC family cysteine-rich protein n=1 Tax=Hymenobacter sp. 15J16-1T3B TaxID=2886941 RepID=UPI001D0F71CC|nr:CPCC family cysteine-rich protein [Hymenobacter sp. 15J16-1T3B]MCC3157091.1 hypothetical protein [Hymenobacter sp. 15J16-1T3B]